MNNQTSKSTADNPSMSLEEMAQIPIGVLAQYSPKTLCRLQRKAINEARRSKHAKQWIEAAIGLKYETWVRAKRLRLGKDSGIIHIDDVGYRLSCDVRKLVIWDGEVLANIAAELAANGKEVTDYMDITYNVPERKYDSLDEELRKIFDTARQLDLSNPSYKLTPTGDEVL